MLLQNLNLTPFFAPVTTADSGPIEDKALSKEDTIEFLGEEEQEQETIELEKDTKKVKEPTDKKDKEEDKEDKEEPEKELSLEDELEEELQEVDDDKLELVVPVRRKEILAEYPDIFKKFPSLESSIYRERAYTELLPTIQDAKQAVEKSERLDMYEHDIMSGSTETLLTAVFNTDRESFAKVVDNYLPTLYKVDEAAYYHTVGNVIKNTIMAMARDGKAENVDELLQAADVVNQYIFGTKQFTPPQRLAKVETKDDAKASEIDEREVEFNQRQFETAKSDITSKTENILKSTIDKNIDPNESMTDYVKRNATREAYEMLEDVISQDTRFRNILDKLWERAFNDNFSSESMGKIKSAYLSKAKTHLPSIIKKVRVEAIRGLGKRVHDDEDTSRKDKRGPLPVGKARSHSASPQSGKTVKDAARAIPKGMRTLDYLNQD
jgi:hypothetical protein